MSSPGTLSSRSLANHRSVCWRSGLMARLLAQTEPVSTSGFAALLQPSLVLCIRRSTEAGRVLLQPPRTLVHARSLPVGSLNRNRLAGPGSESVLRCGQAQRVTWRPRNRCTSVLGDSSGCASGTLATPDVGVWLQRWKVKVGHHWHGSCGRISGAGFGTLVLLRLVLVGCGLDVLPC